MRTNVTYLVLVVIFLISIFTAFRILTFTFWTVAPIERFGIEQVSGQKIHVIQATKKKLRFSNAPEMWIRLSELPISLGLSWLAMMVVFFGLMLLQINGVKLISENRFNALHQDIVEGLKSLKK